MNNTAKILSFCLLLTFVAGTNAFAQRPRAVNDPATSNQKSNRSAAPVTLPAPQTVRAKYEGGVFGYNKRLEGTLGFDDVGKRLVFRDKTQREVLSLPYAAIASAYADTQSRRPAAATVLGSLPIVPFFNPIGLIKKKVRYLTLQYSDPDTKVNGVTSFRLDNKEILASMLNALVTKAGLTQRGEIFVRKEPSSTPTTTTTTSQPTPPQ